MRERQLEPGVTAGVSLNPINPIGQHIELGISEMNHLYADAGIDADLIIDAALLALELEPHERARI